MLAYGLVKEAYQKTNDAAFLKKKYASLLRESTYFINQEISSSNLPPKQLRKIIDGKLPPGIAAVIAYKNSQDELSKLVIEKADKASGYIYLSSGPFKLIYYTKPANSKYIVGAAIKTSNVVEQQKEKLKETIRQFTFDQGLGYVFVLNPKGIILVHPGHPENENINIKDTPAGKNKTFFNKMSDICNKQGQGFLKYLWPKPISPHQDQADYPKLSFVKLFRPWNWIIGTGEYLDELKEFTYRKESEMQEQVNLLILKVLLITLIITAVMIIISLFFSYTISNPISQLIKTMQSIKPDKLSSSAIDLKGCQEIKELGGIFNKMLCSINDGIKTIEKTTSAKERLESELEIAEDIQNSVLPRIEPILPTTGEFDISAHILPGKPVGGDLYDFFFIDDDHLCFAVGDVSDKGVPATLFMTITRTLLRAKAAKGLSSGEIVTEINRSLCANNDMSMYVRYFLAILNLKTGVLCYTNAGQPQAYVQKSKFDLQSLPVIHGIPLGLDSNLTYDEETIKMTPGESIVIYSDGLINATNYVGDTFGEDRLEAAIKKCLDFPTEKIIKCLFSKVSEFIGTAPVTDDIVVLALNFKNYSNSDS
jgi:serine phosphatase RsbU (regulator of sigma subunit)